jgi:hypothetical protein
MRAWKSLEALSVAQVALLALSGAALAADVIAMPGEFAIQTVHPGIYNGFYLTAVDGGGPTNGRFMAATGGGGRIKSVISYPGPNSPREWGGFTLLRQDDGTYALRTASGNYLTAVGGGGLASGTPESDNLHTDATWIRAWETFRLIDQGNCTYAIQTVSGFYLASEEGGSLPASTISTPPRNLDSR